MACRTGTQSSRAGSVLFLDLENQLIADPPWRCRCVDAVRGQPRAGRCQCQAWLSLVGAEPQSQAFLCRHVRDQVQWRSIIRITADETRHAPFQQRCQAWFHQGANEPPSMVNVALERSDKTQHPQLITEIGIAAARERPGVLHRHDFGPFQMPTTGRLLTARFDGRGQNLPGSPCSSGLVQSEGYTRKTAEAAATALCRCSEVVPSSDRPLLCWPARRCCLGSPRPSTSRGWITLGAEQTPKSPLLRG